MMDVCVNMVLKDEKKNSLNKVVNWAEEHLQLVVLLLVLRQVILFIILFIVEVFVVLIFFGRSLGLSLFPLFLILLILHFLLGVLGDSPCLITNLLGKVDVVSDQEVVKDGARLDLPRIETDGAEIVVDTQLGLLSGVIVGVVDFRVDPLALVGRVVDLSWLPLSLVVGVVNHGWLPFAVHLVVPIFGLGGVGVGDGLGFVPVLGLAVLRVIDLLALIPLILAGLLGLRILDLFGGQHIPIVGESALLGRLVVDEDLVNVSFSVQDQGVQVSHDIVLASDVLFDQVIGAFVAEDDVNLLSAWAANVRSKHDVVWRLSVHVLLIEGGGEDFHVSTATVDVLLVLYGELNDCLLALVGELVELGGHGVELGILAGLDALVLLGIAIELAVAQHKLAKVVFVLGVHPPALPVSIEGFLEVGGGVGGHQGRQAKDDEQFHGWSVSSAKS